MVSKEYPASGEIYHAELPNGLHIYVDRRPEFQKSYAFFATNYGGMDMKFRLDGQWRDTPAGVAHFLEHKMFDTEDGNVLQDLAANGASPNAFTSSALTGYYFESTEKFCDNLKILLSFVSIPWFTQESVDKEQGIIGQEIGMIEDDPDWKVFMNLMAALYQHHPIRVSVAGSVESISHITADTLYACHKAFYDPPIWCCAWQGTWTRRRSAAAGRDPAGSGLEHRLPGGTTAPRSPRRCASMISGRWSLGPPVPAGIQGGGGPGGRGGPAQQLLGELACEALLGNSGPLYARLYREGLVNRNFSYGYESYPGCAFLCAGGRARTRRECGRRWPPRRSGSHGRGSTPSCGSAEKSSYGNRVRALNSFEHICISQAQSFSRAAISCASRRCTTA